MVMPIACPNTRLWLQRTLEACIVSRNRAVSTTSAIKRGLRAEGDAFKRGVPQNVGDRGKPRRLRDVGGQDKGAIRSSVRGYDASTLGTVGRIERASSRPNESLKPRSSADRAKAYGSGREGLAHGGRGSSREKPRSSKPLERWQVKALRRTGEWDATAGKGQVVRQVDTSEADEKRVSGHAESKRMVKQSTKVEKSPQTSEDTTTRQGEDFPRPLPWMLGGIRHARKARMSEAQQPSPPLQSNTKLLADMIEAHDEGTGPYRDVGRDELAIRIGGLRRRFSRSDDDDAVILELETKLKRVKQLLLQLQSLENDQPVDIKQVRMTVSSLKIKVRRVDETVAQLLRESPQGYVKKASKLQAAAARYLAGEPGAFWVTSRDEAMDPERSTIWIPDEVDGAESGMEAVLSKRVQAALSPDREVPQESAKIDARDRVASRHEPLSRARVDMNEVTRQDLAPPDEMPLSIPRTKASSTFLYGTNTVLAALRAQRRKVYALYFNTKLPSYEYATSAAIRRLALQASIPTHPSTSRALLNAMSEDRPHNGIVLESSHLPAPPITSLGAPDLETRSIPVFTSHQSAEDRAVNGDPTSIDITNATRQPLVLMLDGILDPQNVGNMLRTAYFYGVDAVAVSTNTCCPLTSAALAKASSGACEAVQILALPRPSDFVRSSKHAGWKIYAAVAPPDANQGPKGATEVGTKFMSHTAVSTLSPLSKHPVLLMLGAEGGGLRDNLRARADYFVGIAPAARDGGADIGVDSINVGTAAAVLVDSFLRQPEVVSVQEQGKVMLGRAQPEAETAAQSKLW